jgi:DNA gyrase subunit A
VANLRVMGRATQGVRLINLKGNDSIAAVAKVVKEEEEEIASEDGIASEAQDTDTTVVNDDSEE